MQKFDIIPFGISFPSSSQFLQNLSFFLVNILSLSLTLLSVLLVGSSVPGNLVNLSFGRSKNGMGVVIMICLGAANLVVLKKSFLENFRPNE